MLSPNTYLQNRYRIIRILGKGGMGHVYEAIDDTVECIVAIKETVADSEKLRKAFEREAKLLANLRHPVLPRVTHYFYEGNRQFLVMDFIEGLNLAELLALRKLPFSYEELVPWAEELLKALEYLHNRSEPIIHRDIKPANIKLTKDGQIYLLDFGLAKGAAGQMSVETGQFNSSIYGYTEAYASPEQINNTGTNPQSDLYSLGATLYHLLTAQIPVMAPRRELKVTLGKPDPLVPIDQINPAVPQPISLVIAQALALDPSNRPASASDMRRALQEARLAIETGKQQVATEKLLETHGAGELAWQETQPPEPLLKPATGQGASKSRVTLPAERDNDSLRAELPTLNTAPPPDIVQSPVEVGGAEVSWPSQINSETEDSQAVSQAVEAEGFSGDEAARVFEREAEESRRHEAEAERLRLEAEAALRQEEAERLRRREAEEEANRLRALEDERLRAEEEARRRQAEEDAAALKRAEEEDARRRAAELALEEARRRESEERHREEMLLLAREEEERRKQQEDLRRQREDEERRGELPQKTIAVDHAALEGVRWTSDGLSAETGVSEPRATTRPPAPTVSSTLEQHRAATNVPSAISPTPSEDKTRRSSSRRRLWLIVGLALVLLGGGALVYAWMHSSRRSSENPLPGGVVPRVPVNMPSAPPPPVINMKQELNGQRGVAWSVAFSPDGSLLASASEDKKVRLWDARSWKLTRTLDGHEEGVNSVAFSQDGKIIASASNDKTVKLWDAQNASTLKTLTGHTDEVYFVAFSPDSRLLASAAKDKTIKLWNTQSGRELRTLTGHRDVVWAVAFSSDGKILASASRDKTVRLWEVQSGKEIRRLTGHTRAVIAVAFSPDGKTLASGSDDRTIKLWDVETWQETRTLSDHNGYITALAFSSDGKQLASASNDKTIQLWDVQTGTPRQKLTGHVKGVNTVAFSPDGKTLASGSKDETVKVWQ